MTDPTTSIVIFFGLVIVAVALFWPGTGLLHHLRESRGATRRIRVEDALKHLYHREERGLPSTLEGIGGALGLPPGHIVELTQWMEKNGLAYSQEERFFLTREGRKYALQIIRAHRLWERFLAYETGVDEKSWHIKAERREHELTPEEIDALATRLGNPRYDPHGDPIPTSDGTVPELHVRSLAQIEAGAHVRVVHIEDEPVAVYQQLIALGVHLGMEIYVQSKNKDRIFVESEGRSFVLAPLIASNISVELITEKEVEGHLEWLSSLQVGETAKVTRISPACRGLERRRLMDLGVVPGTEITTDRKSPSGGLTAYRVRGTVIALRDEQARLIGISREKEVAS
ncbi:MAG: DNA-binding protein [Candidatus Latescibacteria bacterium]|nr:DNA-binding protein [Candidatus Latescibacterota bacterium]NIO00958.1 DNA-binding protein [Candidatus Latescibacterota bacterium]NIO27357.1 DNA-binding protein [Candidatus Latescibacterota bacterium]NIO54879.1 DNA-binding protein [Candidatus Latescibacterota bacterium]NIT00968.1 DNA-binding protein [Candidatus Latescibacterota bacterium]